LDELPFIGPRVKAKLADLVAPSRPAWGSGSDADSSSGSSAVATRARTNSYLDQEEAAQAAALDCVNAMRQVFGVGVVTAWRWYDQGIWTPGDAREAAASGRLQTSPAVAVALQHLPDLLKGVSREETEMMQAHVEAYARRAVARRFGPRHAAALRVEALGGYRRGKPRTSDIDILLTPGLDQDGGGGDAGSEDRGTPSTGDQVAAELLMLLLSEMKAAEPDMQLWSHPVVGHTRLSLSNEGSNGGLDNLDKDLCILRLPGSGRAARVDLIVAHPWEYACAKLGWTGNKLYNRELRRYARAECNLVLTNRFFRDLQQPPRKEARWHEEAGG
jgi:DNA polymerase/3'-5' exonuclease PolX